MTRIAGVALVAALIVAAALWAAVTGVGAVAGLAGLLALASLMRARGTAVSPPLQGLLLLACGVAALSLTSLFPFSPDQAWGDRALHRAWAVLGSGSLLFAAVRTHIEQPEGGVVATVGLGLLCLLSGGSVSSGPVHLASVLIYLPLMFVAVRCADVDRVGWSSWGWRSHTALLGLLGGTALLSALLLAALPGVYDRASAWALQLVDDELKVGFHDGPMALGSLQGMLDSDEIVMRVEGAVGPRLRGNSYGHYANARWRTSDRGKPEERVLADRLEALAGSDETEAAVIRYAAGGADRFFLPLDASAVALSPSRVRVDRYGIARPTGDETPVEARLRLGKARRLVPAAPGPQDSRLPDDLRPPLEALVAKWTKQGMTAEARVRALEARLEANYRYSLHFERSSHTAMGAAEGRRSADAILQFLLLDGQGHCEYFASALVLLARASGLPARLVTGYRVQERNPLGDYHVVRERHAHAWVEVFLTPDARAGPRSSSPEGPDPPDGPNSPKGRTSPDGPGWVAFDPSPLQSFEPASAATTPFLAALVDWLAVELRRRGPLPLLVLLVVAFGGVQLRRLWSGRKRAELLARRPSSSPAFVSQLLVQLQQIGCQRPEGETLEAFAARLRGLSTELSSPVRQAGALLVRTAEWLYGDQGDSQQLERDIQEWITRSEAPSGAHGGTSVRAGLSESTRNRSRSHRTA